MENLNISKISKVAIIGGGVSGLSAAILLSQIGVESEIFEKRAELKREEGKGQTLTCNFRGVRVLKKLGLDVPNLPEFFKMTQFSNHRATQKITPFVLEANSPIYGVHVADLEKLLSNKANELINEGKKIKINMGKTYKKFDLQKATLTFEDDSTVEYDLIIGCDGVKSNFHIPYIHTLQYNYCQEYDTLHYLADYIQIKNINRAGYLKVLGNTVRSFLLVVPLHQKDGQAVEDLFYTMIFLDKEKFSALSKDEKLAFLKEEYSEELFESIKGLIDHPFNDNVVQLYTNPLYLGKSILLGGAAHTMSADTPFPLNYQLSFMDHFVTQLQNSTSPWEVLRQELAKLNQVEISAAIKLSQLNRLVLSQVNDSEAKGRREGAQVRVMLETNYSDRYVNTALLFHCTGLAYTEILEYEEMLRRVINEILGMGMDSVKEGGNEKVLELLDKHSAIIQKVKTAYEQREILF